MPWLARSWASPGVPEAACCLGVGSLSSRSCARSTRTSPLQPDGLHPRRRARPHGLPRRQALAPKPKPQDGAIVYTARKTDCGACPIKPQCTRAEKRTVLRLINEPALERVARRLKAEPTLVNKRAQSVEPAFGTLKRRLHGGRFLLRGRLKARTELGLVTLAFNLKRLANRHGTRTLQQALACEPRHGPAGRLVQPTPATATGGCRHLSLPALSTDPVATSVFTRPDHLPWRPHSSVRWQRRGVSNGFCAAFPKRAIDPDQGALAASRLWCAVFGRRRNE
jgi:hypothetical protein